MGSFGLGDALAVSLNPTALLGTGLAFGGDLLNYYGQRDEGERNREAQEVINERNYQMQKEFAQMGIQWKVDDARKAGIHPLAALGASTSGASPSFNMSDQGSSKFRLAASLSDRMGQNVSRAISASMSNQERLEHELRLENMSLQNDLLRQQRDNQPKNPPLPSGGTDNFIGGQGDSGVMLVVPAKRTSHAPGRPAQEAGARPDVSYSRSDTGLVPVIPEGLSESMEDDVVGKVLWRIRNQLMPNFTGKGHPPKLQLPSGATGWRWHRARQEWQPSYDKKDRWMYTE